MVDNIVRTYWVIVLWLILAIIVCQGPPNNPPGCSPVRVADVAPSHYERPLSCHFREPLDPKEPPLSYPHEQHYAEELGEWAWSEWVQEQGIGE